jgi:hypothetical protein
MLENIREANKEAELFKAICMSLLEEKKLQQLLDRCQYDEGNSEWIVPYVKPLRDSDFRLPDIDGRYGVTDERDGEREKNGRIPSAKGRPGSSQNNSQPTAPSSIPTLPKRPNSRTSRDDSNTTTQKERVKSATTRDDDTQKIPSLTLPSYAPSKPPMPRSARRDKKKAKNNSTNYDQVRFFRCSNPLTYLIRQVMSMEPGKMLVLPLNGDL